MKKLLSLLLVLSIFASLVSCGKGEEESTEQTTTGKSDSAQTENGNIEQEAVAHTGVKLSGQINGASPFSEGLAIVSVSGNNDVYYCINKDGFIVFEFPRDAFVKAQLDFYKFEGGFVLSNIGLYDKKGTLTTAEDLGVTRIFKTGLEDGYILVEKITADYNSSKGEIGVLNFEFDWVVEPSEKIYNTIKNDLRDLDSVQSDSYYYNNTFNFFSNSEKTYYTLDISSGDFSENKTLVLPSKKWQLYDASAYDSIGNILVDISGIENARFGSSFVNGKAPVRFENTEAGKCFFTLVDENCEFSFEPVEVKGFQNITSAMFDGEYTLIQSSKTGTTISLCCFNSKGELVGEMGFDDLLNASISDGVIVVEHRNSYECFTPSFEPLF